MDQQRREQLIAIIKQQGLPGSAAGLPLVSLEDFFVDNDDISSIGCNLIDSPGPQVFFQIFQAIRAKPNVQDVLVEIMEVEEKDQTVWPFSERVYIFADSTVAEIETWVANLEADDVAEGFVYGVPVASPVLLPNMKVFSVWWD